MVTETRDLLVDAVCTLARACDGAHAQDGAGFNRLDADFGRSLANTPSERWSQRQRRAAWSMLLKYRVQLSNYGIDYRAIPEPRVNEAPAAQQRASVKVVAYSHDDAAFTLAYPYDPNLNARLKAAVAGVRFGATRRGEKRWMAPLTAQAVRGLLAFAEREQFTLTDDAQLRARDILAEATPAPFEVSPMSLNLERFNGTLRPYQIKAVRYNVVKERALNALEVGLGKSPIALATYASTLYGTQPCVIVCLSVKKLDWRDEVHRFLPDAKVKIIEGLKPVDVRGFDVVVVNFDVLYKHAAALAALDPFVIIDEGHAIKSKGSRRTKAVQALCAERRFVLDLTGTPILNKPIELAEQLVALNRLKEFGGWFKFATQYCGGYRGRWGIEYATPSAETLRQLNARLRDVCMVRYTKSEVMSDLPPVQRTVVPVEITTIEAYERAVDDFLGYLEEFGDDDAAMRAARAEQLVKVGALKAIAAEGKVEAAIEWIEEFLEDSDQKLIVFSGVRAVQDALVEAFPNAAHILGSDSDAQRHAHKERFQSEAACRVIICASKAAGTGITLTAATNCLTLDFAWTPAEHDQLEGRAYGRANDPHGLNSYYMVAEDTIDEDIAALLDKKRGLVAAVIDGKDIDDSDDILTSLIERIRERRDERLKKRRRSTVIKAAQKTVEVVA